MPSIPKSELLAIVRTEQQNLTALLDEIGDTRALLPGADGDCAVADLRAVLERPTRDLLNNVSVLSEEIHAWPCTWANEEPIAMQAAGKMFHRQGHIQKLRRWLDGIQTA